MTDNDDRNGVPAERRKLQEWKKSGLLPKAAPEQAEA
jgi:hypothetical protein